MAFFIARPWFYLPPVHRPILEQTDNPPERLTAPFPIGVLQRSARASIKPDGFVKTQKSKNRASTKQSYEPGTSTSSFLTRTTILAFPIGTGFFYVQSRAKRLC
jgi:hypothetical protein